jgi:predicted permease
MAVEPRLDWRVAAEAALLTLAVALPPVWVVSILKADDPPGQESNLWLVVPVALLAGFALGGYAAGKRARPTPLMHAAVTGGLAFGSLFVLSVLRRVVGGDGVSLVHVVRLLLLAQICVSCALLGGYVATRRNRTS